MLRAATVAAACLASLAMAGCATRPEDDPVQIKLNDLDTRVARIERVVANQSLLDLANQTEALRSDLRAMRNDIDVLTHNLEAARKQEHDLYADLDQRMKLLEARAASSAAAAAAGGAGGTTPPGATPPGTTLPGTAPAAASSAEVADKVSYQAAFDLLKNGEYDRAITAFQSFLATYPASQLADNAQYWLGEAFYVNKSFPEALAAFQRVADVYPQSRKLPDALLKIGFCDYELKQYGAARDSLGQLLARFPDTPSAGLAKQRLEKMSAEKH